MDMDRYHDQIVEELVLTSLARGPKDILIVVHDQLPLVRECLESVSQHTTDAAVYVWDNGSRGETLGYLWEWASRDRIVLVASPENRGFIVPNNRLYGLGSSPYVILLNSDTRVAPNWAEALVGYLQGHPGVGAVGYQGSRLDSRGEGGRPGVGRDIDYVCGWCACYPRAAVDAVGGLFDEDNLEFAYAEDSDLSLRLREQRWAIHALHLDLVLHHGNKTIAAVHDELGPVVRETFRKNHDYIRRRWAYVLPAV